MNTDFFIAGCIGAIAPEILRLYRIRLRRNGFRFSRFYYAISLLYVLLGGYVATIFPGLQNSFWAMCIGVAIVPTVNTMAKLGELLSLRLKTNFDKAMEDFNRSGRTVARKRAGEQTSGDESEPVRDANFWDYINSL